MPGFGDPLPDAATVYRSLRGSWMDADGARPEAFMLRPSDGECLSVTRSVAVAWTGLQRVRGVLSLEVGRVRRLGLGLDVCEAPTELDRDHACLIGLVLRTEDVERAMDHAEALLRISTRVPPPLP